MSLGKTLKRSGAQVVFSVLLSGEQGSEDLSRGMPGYVAGAVPKVLVSTILDIPLRNWADRAHLTKWGKSVLGNKLLDFCNQF